MNAAGHSVTSIFMSGSQCMSPVLMDLLAAVCDTPVAIPTYVNAAVVHGAAMLGAKAASEVANTSNGITEDLWSVMSRMSRPGRLVKPRLGSGSGDDQREKKLLDEKYRIFLEQSKTQQKYRTWIDEAVGNTLRSN